MKTRALLLLAPTSSQLRCLLLPLSNLSPIPHCSRAFSTSTPQYSPSTPQQSASGTAAIDGAVATGDSRWLSEVKNRIGKCIIFGMNAAQTRRAGLVLQELGRDWRELVAGREGYLVGIKRAGLLRHPVVWGEMDSMGHVNNVMYTRYAESARVNWVCNYSVHVDPKRKREWTELCTPNGDGLILRSIRTDYKFPMKWPDRVSVFHKLSSLPNRDDSSFVLDVMILSEVHQRPAARCVEDVVVYDYKNGKKTPIRPFMMDAFRETWREQEEARRRNIERVEELDRLVRELEKETWDREDAVEDFGGSK